MKKLLTITTTIALVLISAALAQAEVSPEDVERQVAKNLPVYLNDRVKQMCEEWPGCKEWVKERLSADSSFLIVDAEVERKLNNWNENEATWHYHFYVQTRENSHIKAQLPQPVRVVTLMGNMENSDTKAYRFDLVKNGRKFTSSDPAVEKKFPGHPILGIPSQHARYHITISGNDSLSKCQQWEQCKKLVNKKGKRATVSKAVDEQYIYSHDKNGNALWARSLYVQIYYYAGGGDSLVFRAKQEKTGGNYIYEDPHKIMQCPHHPDFTF